MAHDQGVICDRCYGTGKVREWLIYETLVQGPDVHVPGKGSVYVRTPHRLFCWHCRGLGVIALTADRISETPAETAWREGSTPAGPDQGAGAGQ